MISAAALRLRAEVLDDPGNDPPLHPEQVAHQGCRAHVSQAARRHQPPLKPIC
jgi:hypothetical protein